MTHHLTLALPLLLAGALLASNDVTPGMNRFAAAAYRQLAQNGDNLILSPFSISTALSMLLDGARGQTAAGMAATLDQTQSGAAYHAAVAALAAEIAKQANLGGNQLAIANGLWLQQGFPLESEFERTMKTLYQAPVAQLDFHSNAEQARQEINSWTSEHTNGRIAELFAHGSIDAATRLVLTSAIYFLGKWRSPFDPKNTRAEPFQLGGGRTVDAKFMHQKADFLYGETPSAQILEMKYAGTPLAFDILLPKTNDGLAELERSIKPDELSGWFGALTSHKVETAIPKFRADSAFSLKDMLSRMGMADAFGRTADFSGIDGRRDLLVANVVHKAFVDVSEEGTEAAAATGITVRPMAMRRQEQTVFRADHPFAFFIRDTASGAILFEGRLLQPKS
ncbi:MAG: serpin family protein [Bryobacteraceae bacterium]|jgi:serpin B